MLFNMILETRQADPRLRMSSRDAVAKVARLDYLKGASLRRVQAEIRHKPGSSLRAAPHLFRFKLELASAPR
jgi:hypothetical protein